MLYRRKASEIKRNNIKRNKQRHTNSKPIYLNMNATYKSFNSTDVAYSEVVSLLDREQYIKDYIKNYFKAEGRRTWRDA